MYQSTILRFWTALVLTTIVVGSLLTRAVHGVFLHHDHAHERQACSAFHDKHSGNTHLHDQRYAIDDCPVCEFCFALTDCVPSCALLHGELVVPDNQMSFYASVLIDNQSDTTFLRGPPQA